MRGAHPESVQPPSIVSVAYTDLPSDARVLREAREAARYGAQVTLVVPEAQTPEVELDPKSCRVVWLPVRQERGRTTLTGQMSFTRALRRWIGTQTQPPAIVHIHNMPDYLYWAFRGWQRAGSRIVLDVHDIMSELAAHRFPGPTGRILARILAPAEESVWRRVDHIITVHEPYRSRIGSRGIPLDRVDVVPNFPDSGALSTVARRTPPVDRFKITFHGTISRRTGVLHALRAMPILLRSVPHAHLLIVGGGNGIAECHATIRELGLANHVTFIDRYLPHPQVMRLVADAHCGVVPNDRSLYTRSILPAKLLEYAGLGIPAVATRLPVIEEYLGEEATHLIADPDPDAIAEALRRLAQDDEYRLLLGRRAREAVGLHSWARYAGAFRRALFSPGAHTEPARRPEQGLRPSSKIQGSRST